MRFFTAASVVALAASTAADTTSSKSDLDGSVWQGLSSVKARSFGRHNRPAKRQSGWNPPSDIAAPLKEVWDHVEETYNSGNLFGFKNYGWDQLIAGKGTINMCVRWESSESVTEAQRTKVASALQAQYDSWFKWTAGFDGFPYESVKVNVVGWAVKDKSLLQGSTSGIDVYTDTDGEGIPQCAESCGRFFHQDGDYSGCSGGADRHYDHSLWLTDGMSGGAGGDWGQRIGREYFMGALDSANIHILQHEMGHTFGLDDFYDWTPTGVSSFIMLAGSASQITDFDGWMFRNWWYELSRERGWQSGTTDSDSGSDSGSATPSSAAAEAPAATSAPAAEAPAATSAAPAVEVPAATTALAAEEVTEAATPVEEQAEEDTSSGAATAGRYAQCGGGSSYSGPTKCESGLTCTKHNEWYAQCL
ncbi:hypothetical protein ACJ41O_005622 [Fusarium nematophilum]